MTTHMLESTRSQQQSVHEPLLNSITVMFQRLTSIFLCGRVTMAGCQMPTQLLSHSPSSARGENTVKNLVGQDTKKDTGREIPY